MTSLVIGKFSRYSLKVVVPVRSIIRAGFHAAGFETCGRSRTGRDRCGRVFRSVRRRRGRNAPPSMKTRPVAARRLRTTWRGCCNPSAARGRFPAPSLPFEAYRPRIPVARTGKILLQNQTDLPRPVLSEKIFRFPPPPNHLYIRSRPVPLEGRIAIVTDVGTGCSGRGSARARRDRRAGR